MVSFDMFFRFRKYPDEVRYVPYLVFSQLEDCIDKGTSNPDYTQKIPEELWVQVQPNLIIRAPTTV